MPNDTHRVDRKEDADKDSFLGSLLESISAFLIALCFWS